MLKAICRPLKDVVVVSSYKNGEEIRLLRSDNPQARCKMLFFRLAESWPSQLASCKTLAIPPIFATLSYRAKPCRLLYSRRRLATTSFGQRLWRNAAVGSNWAVQNRLAALGRARREPESGYSWR